MDKIEKKRQQEKEMVSQMIVLYCRKNHHTDELCEECRELIEYAKMRSDKCPFMESKTFCSNCKAHCYKAEMREKIKKVMRFAGPRMIFVHPVAAIRHVIATKMEKKKLESKR